MSDIKQKTKIGMMWNVFEKMFVQFISFLLNIILARLLTPHDYGTIGMLTIFLTFSNVFIDSGFSRALIQKQNRTEKDFSTVLIFNIVISCLLYLVLFISSPLIAKFYKTPELVSLERVFFLVIIFNSLTVVQNSQLQINVDFKKIAIINSITTLLSGIIGVIVAYYGLGAWALVIQSVSRSVINSSCFWIIGKWKPKTGFSRESFRNLFGFGSKLLISGLLGTTVTNINNLVIGKVYSAESLGYYTRAQQFPELTAGTMNSVVSGVTFPLLSSIQNDEADLVETTKRLLKITAMFIFPLMTGLAFLSKPIIFVLLGEKWSFSIPLLFWLSFAYIFNPLSAINLNVLNAIGRSDVFLKADLIKIPILIFTMIITFPINLHVVVVGKALTAFFYYYINAFMLGKLYKLGCFSQLKILWKYIVSSIVMGSCVYVLTRIIKNNICCLIVSIVVAVIIYAIALVLLKDEEFFILIKRISKIKKD